MNKQTIITLLLAPDGTILAHGLRGEDIEKKTGRSVQQQEISV